MKAAFVSYLLLSIFIHGNALQGPTVIQNTVHNGREINTINIPAKDPRDSKKKLPINYSDFECLVKDNRLFVDKSLWIKRLLEDDGFLHLITRPRGFGKTLNLSMLKYFLDVSANKSSLLFDDLQISSPEHEKFRRLHQNQYTVFYFNFLTDKVLLVEDMKGLILEQLHSVLAEQVQLNRVFLSKNELKDAEIMLGRPLQLPYLLGCFDLLKRALFKKGRKFVVLVDSYDAPFLHAFAIDESPQKTSGIFGKKGFHDQTIAILQTIYLHLFKYDPLPKLGVMMGTNVVAKTGILSDLNVQVFSILSDKAFSSDFGFSEHDVEAFMAKSGTTLSLIDMKRWYEGYHIGDSIQYNPVSVVTAVRWNTLGSHWINTASLEAINRLIEKEGDYVRMQLGLLLSGVPIRKRIYEELVYSSVTSEEESFWTLLVHEGYVCATSKDSGTYELTFPNLEVKNYIQLHCKEDPVSDLHYRSLMDSFYNLDFNTSAQEFRDQLSFFVDKTSPFYDLNGAVSAKVPAGFIMGILGGLYKTHDLQRVEPSALSRMSDIIIYSKDKNTNVPAVVLHILPVKRDENVTEVAKHAVCGPPMNTTKSLLKRISIEQVLRIVFPFYRTILAPITCTVCGILISKWISG